MTFVPPKSGLNAFTCPHCGVLARQYHFSNYAKLSGPSFFKADDPIHTSICEFCEKYCIWNFDKLIFPNRGNAPPPNPDMPDEVKTDYEEAANIIIQSPRGAAALLRLALQKLIIHLGGKGSNLNDDIAKLVKQGLPVRIQQALDVARVIGNNAVHPGQIDFDDIDTSGNLFIFLNLITEYMMTLPEKVEELYKNLPDNAKDAINRRDNKSDTVV